MDIKFLTQKYDIDLISDTPEKISIEVESTPDSKFPPSNKYPYPKEKWFTIPLRKWKNFQGDPNSFFIKINSSRTRSCIVSGKIIMDAFNKGNIITKPKTSNFPCGAYSKNQQCFKKCWWSNGGARPSDKSICDSFICLKKDKKMGLTTSIDNHSGWYQYITDSIK